VEWSVGLDHEAAGRALGEAAFAYLPFPDGASERRGSLLACLAAGNVVVTTRGPQTPSALDGAVRYAASPHEAAEVLGALAADERAVARLRAAAMAFAARFSWESIAERHVELYRTLAPR
jgi:glycosyltransferase involved in cell wall biosynthesis